MKKFDKDQLLNLGVYAVGLSLVVISCMRDGARQLTRQLESNGITLTDKTGNLVEIVLPSMNPFKK